MLWIHQVFALTDGLLGCEWMSKCGIEAHWCLSLLPEPKLMSTTFAFWSCPWTWTRYRRKILTVTGTVRLMNRCHEKGSCLAFPSHRQASSFQTPEPTSCSYPCSSHPCPFHAREVVTVTVLDNHLILLRDRDIRLLKSKYCAGTCPEDSLSVAASQHKCANNTT